jgi:hypothetical protein
MVNINVKFLKNFLLLILNKIYIIQGSVAVYDLLDKEIKTDKYKMSPKNTIKHVEPVWQIKWQKNDIDDYPNFCTISSDGSVLIWTIKNVS